MVDRQGKDDSETGRILEGSSLMLTELEKALGQHFRFVRPLGSGGTKSVYQVENLPDGQMLALKVIVVDSRLRTLLERSGDTVEGLVRREGSIYPFQGNDHVNPILSVRYEAALNAYLITEPLCDGTFERLLVQPFKREFGPMPLIQCLYYVQQISHGLGALHDIGKPHGDLKLSNILVKDYQLKLSDFGLASYVEDIDIRKNVGAAGIRAPGPRPTTKSDVWELCALFFRLVTGTPGVPNEKAFSDACQAAADRRPGECGKPAEVAAILGPLLSINPDERPSLKEVDKRLGWVMSGCSYRLAKPVKFAEGESWDFIASLGYGGAQFPHPFRRQLADVVRSDPTPLPPDLRIDPRFATFLIRWTEYAEPEFAAAIAYHYVNAWGSETLRTRLRAFEYDELGFDA
jgi:serine/threonine protein kinase